MKTNVAVVLAGCGVFDGSEIYEATLTLLRLSQRQANVQCFAPDIPQSQVINHLTGEVMDDSRNVLVEAARLTRGNIHPLDQARPEDFDALIVPGGFGVAKNLCNFAMAGTDMVVNDELLAFAQAMHRAGKPIGLICIAPVMAAALMGKGVKATIGHDAHTAAAVNATGAVHCECSVLETCIDQQHKLVTTPAYMLAGNIADAAVGISKLVDEVLAMA